MTFDISAVDTASWFLMEGEFTASGGESNLTIGSFSYGPEIIATLVGSTANSYAQYNIDDLYLGSCGMGIGEARSGEALKAWPVPVRRGEEVTIHLGVHTAKPIVVEVVDLVGRVILDHELRSIGGIVELPTRGLASGRYTARMTTEGGLLGIGNFVVTP